MAIDVTDAMPPRAAALGERLLAPLGRRWRHVEGVARRAGSLSSLASAEERPAVVTAAWLHDVGYAPGIVVTGLHPLDGARYLRSEGWPELVVCLVAHHTGAEVEAEERGLSRELAEFDRPPEPLLDLVTTADLTTSPDGEEVDARQRLAEIVRRDPPGDPVHSAVTRSGPSLLAAAERVSRRLWREQLSLSDVGLPDPPG